MLVELVDKQRRAVSVVKTALLAQGITGRSICISAFNWHFNYGREEANFAVFVSPPNGTNCEPIYESGHSIPEAVKKMINTIKMKNGANPDDQSEEAPF